MRYLPLTDNDRSLMKEEIGISSISDLYQKIPSHALSDNYELDNHKSEIEVERYFRGLASKNRAASEGSFFLGVGCYNHHIPASVDHIIQRSEFLTSYTPYQPEIAQGTLTYIYEFQSYIAQLTGMDVANASMYDGATSLAEAVLMAKRINKRNNIHIGNDLNPEYKKVLQSYTANIEGSTIIESADIDEQASCLIIQLPDFYGNTAINLQEVKRKCEEQSVLLIVVNTEILAFGILPAPEFADIVVGEAQSIGVGMNFGGPHLGYFACKEKYLRQMPGRLCGKTIDIDGKESYVLTLNTREQHIRREKATSNICSNQGLCALAFTIHMSLLGEIGFKKLSLTNHQIASNLADKLSEIDNVKIVNDSFFNEFTIETTHNSDELVNKLAEKNIVAGYPVKGTNKIIIAVTELTTNSDIELLTNALRKELS